ncbi:MAG: permease [Planctomycetota bacterium]
MENTPSSHRYVWCNTGDINAFFGLMLDNIAGLILMTSILAFGFGFPMDFALTRMVPGTALGVLVGDLLFVIMAFGLAKKLGRDVTAMPLGLDPPSIFGITSLVLGPSFLEGLSMGLEEGDAAMRTWHIGIWCIVLSGIMKLILSPATGWLRRVIPRAGLLGSLAAIALVLISFLPLAEILAHPLVGMTALVIVLTTLIARVPLPGNIPGTLGALIISGGLYYLMAASGIAGYHLPEAPAVTWLPNQWLDAWTFGWLGDFSASLPYLPIALPFALATVVGGIDCAESAAAAGDDYDTKSVIGVEAIATIIAGLSGGVIQTTPYIGHPAYKAMGGRAAYTLATALFVGGAGLIGYFTIAHAIIPAAAVFPILVFIGVEITAQSFHATPTKHYTAVAIACLPALAFLALNIPGRIFGDEAMITAGLEMTSLKDVTLLRTIEVMTMVSSGFILVSLLWSWAFAACIDHHLKLAAKIFGVAAILTIFGVIHSPLPGGQLFLPIGPASWEGMVLPSEYRGRVFEFAAGYAAAGALLWIWCVLLPPGALNEADDSETLEAET